MPGSQWNHIEVFSNLNESVILYGDYHTQTEASERGSKSGMASPQSMSFTGWFRGRDKFEEWYQGLWKPSHFLLSEIIRILPTCLLAAIESQQLMPQYTVSAPKLLRAGCPLGHPTPSQLHQSCDFSPELIRAFSLESAQLKSTVALNCISDFFFK